MNLRVSAFGFWLAFGIQVAIAQDVTTVSRDMEFHGNLLSPKAVDADSDVSVVSLQGLDSGISMNLLSKIAGAPGADGFVSKR